MRVLPQSMSTAVSGMAGSAACRSRITGLLAAAVLTIGAPALAGCGVPPELRPTTGVPTPSGVVSAEPSIALPSIMPPAATTAGGGSPTPFPETVSAPCAGKPTSDQVVALVRRNSSILPATGTVSVVTGPLCAGSWQYTVLQMTGREPLQVVSKGAPESLTLVTAGTDICNIEVRNYAPPGIRRTALC